MVLPMATVTVSEQIANAVRTSGHSQSHIAHHLGLSRVSINDRLRGRTRWSVDDVLALADLLDVHVSDLIEVEA